MTEERRLLTEALAENKRLREQLAVARQDTERIDNLEKHLVAYLKEAASFSLWDHTLRACNPLYEHSFSTLRGALDSIKSHGAASSFD